MQCLQKNIVLELSFAVICRVALPKTVELWSLPTLTDENCVTRTTRSRMRRTMRSRIGKKLNVQMGIGRKKQLKIMERW